MKCCQEQLRHASEREELVELLSSNKTIPWTFHRVAEEIGGNKYEDISHEKPDDLEWERAQNPVEETPPVQYRL